MNYTSQMNTSDSQDFWPVYNNTDIIKSINELNCFVTLFIKYSQAWLLMLHRVNYSSFFIIVSVFVTTIIF